jgi:hypothetical protein
MDSSNVTLQGLDHCIVDLRSSFDNNLRRPITAVHAQDVKNSVLLLPKLSGSIIMYDIQNCVIVVECQQVSTPCAFVVSHVAKVDLIWRCW